MQMKTAQQMTPKELWNTQEMNIGCDLRLGTIKNTDLLWSRLANLLAIGNSTLSAVSLLI